MGWGDRLLGGPPRTPAPAADERWQDQRAELPSVKAGKTIVMSLTAIRVTFALQLLLSLPHGVTRATRPWLYLTASLAVVAAMAVVSWVTITRGRPVRAVVIADIAVASLLIASEAAFVLPADWVGTWVAWGFGYAVVCAVHAGSADDGWRLPLGGALALAVAYVLGGEPWAGTSAVRWALAINAVAIFGFSVASRYVCRYVLDASAMAEAMLSTVAASVARQVSDQTASAYRATVHDLSGALGLLTQDLSPAQRALVTPHAVRIADQARGLLRSGHAAGAGNAEGGSLPELVSQAVGVPEDGTRTTLHVDLREVAAVSLDARQGAPLVAAVRTLVANVHQHAHAGTITVTGARTDTGWELTIADDGAGFDTDGVTYGYGLIRQAGSDLHRVGIRAVVESAPGRGTRVTLSGGAPTEGPR